MGCINLGSFKVVGLWLTTTQHVVQSPPPLSSAWGSQRPQGCGCVFLGERGEILTHWLTFHRGVCMCTFQYHGHGKQTV